MPMKMRAYICDVAADCHEVIEAESEDVFLFFSLGQNIEQLGSANSSKTGSDSNFR